MPLSQWDEEVEASLIVIERVVVWAATKLALRRWYGCGDREKLRFPWPSPLEGVLASGRARSAGCTEFIGELDICVEYRLCHIHFSFRPKWTAGQRGTVTHPQCLEYGGRDVRHAIRGV